MSVTSRKGMLFPHVITYLTHPTTLRSYGHVGQKLRYFDWDGQVHIAKGKTGGQQGDPLEMLIFNLTVHHIWGHVLAKFQGSRVVTYTDDGYTKGNLSVTLQVLTELKRVLKEDAGLELNILKTVILPLTVL
jgi:hypothetical protein